MKSERLETVTVADGFETLANPTALSLIEIDPFEELEEEDDDELDEELDDEDEELEEEPTVVLM